MRSAKTQFLFLAMAMISAGAFVANAEDATPASNDTKADASVLRVCAAAQESPYSMRDKTGFENRIGETLAAAMGRKVEFVWYDKPAIYLVRDQLDPKACDVVIGLDTADERVLTSKPYYRAPYVFIVRTDSPLDITDWSSPDLLKAGKIGYTPGTPAETMMNKLGLFNANFNYVKSLTNYKSPRNQYVRIDPAHLVGDVASGTADVAIGFGPEVARYVKETDGKVKMIVIPDDNTRADGEKVPFHFDQSIGVRKDDQELMTEIDAALAKAATEIETVLKDEGIPIVKPGEGSATPPKS